MSVYPPVSVASFHTSKGPLLGKVISRLHVQAAALHWTMASSVCAVVSSCRVVGLPWALTLVGDAKATVGEGVAVVVCT